MCVPPSFGLGRVRMLWRNAPLFFALLIAVPSTFWPLIAYAGTITVDGTTCTLPDAIAAANTDLTVGSCTISGSPGSDTLLLTAPSYALTYNASYTNVDGDVNSTPSITTTMVISSEVTGGSLLERTGGSNARLLHVGTTGNLTLRGVTIQNGNSGASHGGAIFNRGQAAIIDSNLQNNVATRGGGLYNTGTVTVTNVLIYSNQATGNGGGLFNNNTSKRATLIDSRVYSNTATSLGGGIYNNNGGSIITITNTEVISNRAGSGGGIYINNSSSKLFVTDSFINLNRATSQGGAIYLNSTSSAVISNTEIITNLASSSGGGIYMNNDTDLSLTNSNVSVNRSGGQGGAIHMVSDGTAVITNTLILTNVASSQGGGLYLGSSSSAVMTATMISGNRSSSSGGGIYTLFGSNTVILTNGEIFSNTATGDGGGIYNADNLMLTNTDVISNSAGGEGGGVYSFKSGSTTFVNSDLISNRAGGDGGALYSYNNNTLTDSDVLSNTSSGQGGGIYIGLNGSAAVTLNNSDVIANYASQDGGGIFSIGSVQVTNSDLLSNTSSSGSGGAVYIDQTSSSSVQLTNSHVMTNYAGVDGGGIYNGHTATLSNSNVVSNTALGDGGGIYSQDTSSSAANLVNSHVIANYAGGDGGGLYSGNSTLLNNSNVLSNTSLGSGGGFYNNGPAILSNADVSANSAANRGGGIYNSGESSANLTDSDIISNSAGGDGGGFFINIDSSAVLVFSDVLSNTTLARGGGIFNNSTSEITLIELEIRANHSITNGGGINNNGIATLSDVRIFSNTTSLDGGGFYNNFKANFIDTDVIYNTAARNGGGIYSTLNSTSTVTTGDVNINSAGNHGGGIYNNGLITVSLSYIMDNQATLAGGGFYQGNGQSTITQTRVLTNEAGVSGGALLFESGAGTINESCIVSNSDLALNYLDSGTIDALNNWWGAPDGPSGAALGAGDSITNSVLFSPFESSAILDCSARSADVAVSKQVTPSINLLPGQPLTFTVIITNNDTLPAHNLRFEDSLPAVFQLSEVISSGTAISQEVSGFRLPSLASGDSASFTLRGTISSTLNADQFITNTATVSNSLTGLLTVTASANVKVPVLSWSQTSYSTAEDSGLFTATVVLSPTNPYAAVTAQATIPATTHLTFTAGVGSQPVAVPIVDDAIILSRTIPLTLLSALGAALDDEGGDTSTILLVEDDAAPALAVEKHANTTHAYVGETITYTYRITNTGNVSLTIGGAADDELGALAGLLGYLDLLATRTVTLTHLVQAGDLPGPLVNTVTVTGTDMFANVISPTTSAGVTLLDPTPVLAVEKRANMAQAYVGETITYTYRITNTGNITLSVTDATDDKLGALAGLLGQLGLAESRSVTLTHLVEAGDLPGPLVNTVAVTATDFLAHVITPTTSVSVTLLDPTPALVVEKRANLAHAFVGETITYSYRLTNTGNITLSVVSATDDKLGAVAGLLGQLGLLETRTVTLTHLVQESDLPGPLVNTVTVSGTDRFGNGAMDDAAVSVTLADRSVLFSKRASSAGNLLPGQPLTYTLTITNTDAATLNNLVVSDLLPAAFQLDSVETSGPSITEVGGNYVINELLGLQVATIDFVGTVDPTPTSDFVLTNTATLSNSIIGILSASASNNVVVPRVNWSEDEYTVDEKSGIFTATLLLSPANPYGSVSVQVIVTEGSPAALQAFEVQTITFPPNSTSQPVVVSFVEDGVVVPRSFSLQLQSLSGGALGGGINGGLANLEIIEADAEPAIAVAASVNTAQASVGQTISYTYRITNTGNVTFATISGVKDEVETVDGLAGSLAPNQSRTVIFPYVVQESDLPGPRVSELVVTATDVLNTVVTGNATTSVNITPPTALPGMEQPQQPRVQLYLPSLQGD